MRKSIISVITGMLVMLTFVQTSAQIQSTTSGGNWSSPLTWVGGTIPGSADDVVINGTVDCDGGPSCNNITIEATGTIRNDYYSGTLTVNGNITNNGSIQNYSNSFTLYIKGDIVNNGSWTNYYTRPNGTVDQSISCQNGHEFSGSQFHNYKPSGDIYFNGTVNYNNCDAYLNNANVYLQTNSTLNLHNGQFRNCTLYGSGSSSIVFAEGVFNVDATIIEYIDFNNLTLDGEVKFYSGCSTHGTVYNNGNLQNAYYSVTSNLYDDFINNGTIRNYSNGFTLDIYGNFTNNNVVENYAMNFRSDVLQQVTLQAGKTFSPTYWTSLKPSGSIEAMTDLYFEDVTIDMNYDSLFLQNNGLLNLSNSHFTEGKVQSLNAKSGYFTLHSENNGSTDYMTLTNATLTGEFQCGNYVYFRGTTTNNGIMHNDYFASSPELHDLFINNGTIQNESYGFTLNIYGDFNNNNIVDNYAMNFYSPTDQFVTLLNGKQFTPTYFTSLKPSGKIIATNDLYFYNTIIDFNYDTLLLQNNGKISIDGGYLTECYLLSNSAKSGNIKIWMGNNANLNYSEVINPEILGIVKTGSATTFIGNTLITDTLQNDYYGYTLNIEGDITNNGIIQNYSGALTLNISGNIVNNGSWQNSYTYLIGSNDQHVICLNNLPFAGYQFIVSNSIGLIYFDTEVRFDNCQVKFEGHNLELPEDSRLFMYGSYITSCNLHGNGPTSVVHGDGVYSSGAPSMINTTLENVTLTGDWGLQSDIIMNGSITNEGRLQNDYYPYSVVINADFINNGTIRSFSSGLTMKMYGNFTNNGNWAGYALNLYGDTDQTITLADGKIFNPTYFTSYKPSGNIVALTNLDFVETYVNMEHNPLIMPDNSTLKIDNRYLIRGDISAETDRFNLYMINGAYMEESNIYDATLFGTTNIGSADNFYGTIINQGIMQNNYYTYTVNFYGDLINNGTVQNYSSGLYLKAHANITNNGNWTNYYTTMVGTTDQYIYLKNGHWITGQMRIASDALNGSYQWYWNSWAIVTAYPDPDPFSGYTNSTLVFNTPVSSSWNGTFKCWSNGSYSRNIIVDELSSMRLDLTAFLKGPFNGTNMNTDLNSIIPQQQSLGVIGYEGPEAVSAIPNTNIVDWIGVELRDAPNIGSANEGTTVGGGAFFILNDGKVVGLDGSSMLSFDLEIANQLFVVIWHRNHLPVISQYPLSESGGIYTYDFTTAANQAYGSNQNNLGGGKFGMIAGNANGDGDIDEVDGTESWIPEAGKSGYFGGDVNMDGQVNNQDKNDVWLPNYGKSIILP